MPKFTMRVKSDTFFEVEAQDSVHAHYQLFNYLNSLIFDDAGGEYPRPEVTAVRREIEDFSWEEVT
jgi:hypothetical protein